tara:strand:+ start:32 stop:1327 length:1296 start_codon:yes stop_codon:yes gene_type:complete
MESNMLPYQSEVVVIGAGIAGSAISYELAKRGISVSLFEKGDPGDEQSTRNWGWVSQIRNPVEAPIQQLAQKIWPTLSNELGTDIEWIQEGGMSLTNDPQAFKRLKYAEKIMSEAGVPSKALLRPDIEAIIPELSGEWIGGYYTSTNGQADPRKTTMGYYNAALELGVKSYTKCAVNKLEILKDNTFRIYTDLGEIRSEIIVIASGAWSSKLARSIGLKFPQNKVRATVSRTTIVPHFTKTNVWGLGVAVRQRQDGRLIIAGDGTADYDITLDSFRDLAMFLPAYLNNWSKIRLNFGKDFFQDITRKFPWSHEKKYPYRYSVNKEPKPNMNKVQSSLKSLIDLFPHLENQVDIEESWAGYIDSTPDRTPIVGNVPHIKGLYLATGFSGHGFAMGPGTGRVISELIVDGSSSVDIHGLRYSRFKEKDLNPQY